jgi:2-aminoadipate transaminase
MPVPWQQLYAERTEGMRASDIREILKLTAQPEVISLAGGLPAPELFPIDEYRRAFEWVLEADGAQALQYGPSEGYGPLRAMLAERLTRFGMVCGADNILVTNGSQQALDLVGKVFLDPGDTVMVEKPTYLGALQAFNQYQPRYAVVPMDDDGMRVEEVEALITAARAAGERIKFIYALPNFQNPTGRTMSLARRKQLVELSSRFGIPIVEDDPYGELRYEGESLPSLKSLDRDGTVIYLGTFSKILAPGFRLGWVLASPSVSRRCCMASSPRTCTLAWPSRWLPMSSRATGSSIATWSTSRISIASAAT